MKEIGVGLLILASILGVFLAAMFGIGCIVQWCGFLTDVPALLAGMATILPLFGLILLLGLARALGDSFLNEVIRGK